MALVQECANVIESFERTVREAAFPEMSLVAKTRRRIDSIATVRGICYDMCVLVIYIYL